MTTADTIPARLFANANNSPNAPAYHAYVHGKWQAHTWSQFAGQVRDAGRAMLALGIQRGMCLPILSGNRPEWPIFGLAAMSIGSSAAGLYTNQDANQIQAILAHAEAPIVLIESREIWQKIHAKRDQLPLLRQIIMMPNAPPIDDPLTLSWEAFLACGDITPEEDFFKRLARIAPEQLALYAYSYDANNGPKGVMLSHSNLTWTASILADLLGATPQDMGFSNLPQAHITEQLFSLHLPITAGYPVCYGRSTFSTYFEDLNFAKPTLLFTLPQVWQQVAQHCRQLIGQLQGTQSTLARWACQQGLLASRLYLEGASPRFPFSWKLALARALSLQPIKASLGLDRVRFCASSLTSIAPNVSELLASLELPVFELYGTDETTGIALCNLPGTTKHGSVGLPLPEVEHDLDEQERLKIRGPNVFIGYYKDQRNTAQAIKFGWHLTNEPASIDDEGYVFVHHKK